MSRPTCSISPSSSSPGSLFSGLFIRVETGLIFISWAAPGAPVRNLPSIQKQLYRPASQHPRVAPEPLFDLEDKRSKPVLGLLPQLWKFFATGTSIVTFPRFVNTTLRSSRQSQAR